MAEVNRAYKHGTTGRYEKFGLNSHALRSTLKFLPCKTTCQLDGQPSGPTNTTDYIDPHVVHMDK